MTTMRMFSRNSRDRSPMAAIFILMAFLTGGMLAAPAQAAIVYISQSSGSNDALPLDGSAGALTINQPAGVTAGRALIASIAARPSNMTVTVPAGWVLMTSTQQPDGGVSTLPGGMTLLTYYKIATVAEPASYTWTFANGSLGQGGSAVGGILVFSGIDTSAGSPINVWSARLNANDGNLIHLTTSITPTVTNTMIVSSISYLSGSSFGPPSGITGIVERLDQRAPAVADAIGTTLQMSTAPWATATATGNSQATAAADDDTGVGHLMALKPSAIDLDISMTRSGPLVPGGSASYTMTVINNGINSEPGPLTIVDTLPAGLTYNPTGSGGTGWVCGAVGQVVTCTRVGALAAGATAPALTLNVNVSAGATGTLTNTATVSGTGGDGNTANNTAVDSYTFDIDLAITKVRSGALNPGQNGTYTLTVSNLGTLAENGPITITDVLPAQLTFVSGTGTGWSPCTAVGQTVTCTRAGSLAAGASAAAVTLTVAVSQTASSVSNTASVSGTSGDVNAANNSSTDSYTMTADLSLTKTRGGNLVPGSNATYTLTVGNAGPNTSPHPITVTDALPAGLSFVSGIGTNWTCNAVGQNVTCTHNATLASGASSSVVLTVAVGAGASGTITNSATVSGTATDSVPANDTGTDSYTIPVQSYAYYKMDDTSWGAVIDSNGNQDGSVLGSATPTGFPPPSPPGSAIPGNIGTCGAGRIPITAGSGVNTGIDINNTLGNAGSVTFWYSSNTAWNDGNDRMLLDASNNLGAGGADKHFYLVKGDGGELRFGVEDSGDNNDLISSGANNFPANQWHHIAITWDWNAADRIYLYLDGVAVANTAVANNIGNFAALYLGTTHANIAGTDTDFTTNTANGYLDEVRVYAVALTAAQVAADMNATHFCGSIDHYELSLAASSITCLPTTVTVTACADSSSPCTSPYAAASGTTASLSTSGATLGSGTVTFNASGVATTTLSYPGASNGTSASVTLSGEALPAANPRQCCQGGSCVVANSCATTFNTAGFIVSASAGGTAATIPAQTAGVSSATYYLRAVRTSTTTQACEAALTGANTVDFAYECNNPTTCTGSDLMSVNGGSATTIARNDNGSVSSYLPVDMTFDANGNAPFTFNYSDVGQVTLHASKAADVSLLSALTGVSNAFVVKPHHFDLTEIKCTTADAANCAPGALPSGNNPAAADATGASFIQAGKPFSVKVTARTLAGTATPNYGKETSPEGIRLDTTLVASTGPANPAITYTTGFGAFNSGEATGTDFSWGEVGIITLTPGIGDGNYLGAGDVTGNASGNVGRFIPQHFSVVKVHGCNTFTYSNQEFTQVIVTAKNAGAVTTANYSGGFARNVGLSDGNGSAAGAFGNGTFAAGLFAGGTQTKTDVKYTFATKETEPLTLALRATESAGDGVTSAVGPVGSEDPAEIRSGRLRLINVYGSELVPLSVPMRVEHYSSDGWITNAADTCTTLNGTILDLENAVHDPAQGVATINIKVSPNMPSTVTVVSPAAGTGSLDFSAPGAGGDGYADASMNLSAQPWLQYDWDGTAPEDNPTGRATFGLYRGSPRHIYLRERY